jgi:hypothetical protein
LNPVFHCVADEEEEEDKEAEAAEDIIMTRMII